MDRAAINPAASEFEVVYVNGDHNIPAIFTSTEAEGGIARHLKIRQKEPEFLSRMFAGEEEQQKSTWGNLPASSRLRMHPRNGDNR